MLIQSSYSRILFITLLFLFPSISFALGDTNPNVTNDSCVSLKYNLNYGMKDADTGGEITKLQSFLKSNGYLNGLTTGFFGLNTRNAVKLFQKDLLEDISLEDIDSSMVTSAADRQTLMKTGFRLSTSGYVGVYTRAKIAYVTCEKGDTVTTTVPNTTVATTVTTPVKTTTVSTVTSSQPQTVKPSCTGMIPSGAGVRLGYYTEMTAGPTTGSANTVWTYGAGSCGWTCDAPMIQSGNGCKNPAPGTGVTVTLNNLSTGQKFTNAQVAFGMAGLMLSRDIATYTTNSNGVTSEVWFGQNFNPGGSWTYIAVNTPGYKIRSATGCTPQVFIHGGKQVNSCINAVDGTPVVIDMVSGDISTVPSTIFTKSSYTIGEKLEGRITGGDPKDTWACMDSPNTQKGYECTGARSDVWRKLGGEGDGWQIVAGKDGDTIVLTPMSTAGYPAGTYTAYTRTGQFGGTGLGTSFILTK